MAEYITTNCNVWYNYYNEIYRLYKKRNNISVWITICIILIIINIPVTGICYCYKLRMCSISKYTKFV